MRDRWVTLLPETRRIQEGEKKEVRHFDTRFGNSTSTSSTPRRLKPSTTIHGEITVAHSFQITYPQPQVRQELVRTQDVCSLTAVSVQAKFERAVAIVGKLPPEGDVQPTQDDKLAFYSYFKQAKEGDCNAPAPGMFDFVGKAKYKAWKALEGTSKEDAMQKYVELLESMLKKADDEQSKAFLKELEEAGATA